MSLKRFLCTSCFVMAIGTVSFAGLMTAQEQLSAIDLRDPFPLGSGTITGIVLTDTGQPARATVSLRPEDRYRPIETASDDNGHFTFHDVPNEALELIASMAGFTDAVYGQARPGFPGTPIRLGSGQQLSVVLQLTHGPAIMGRVFDPDGNPAPGIHVYASRLRPLGDGQDVMTGGGDALTDENGDYRIRNLPTGRYVVWSRRVGPNWEPPPIQHMTSGESAIEVDPSDPSVPSGDSAEQTVIQGADRFGIDLHLLLTPVTTIRGVVRDLDGHPAGNVQVRLSRQGNPGALVSAKPTDARGAFEFSRVFAGDYDVSAYTGSGDLKFGRVPVTSDGRKPLSITVDFHPSATVTGRVVFDGRTPAPSWDHISLFFAGVVGLQHEDVMGAVGSIALPEFTYRGVPPGHYTIEISHGSLPPGWTLESEMVDGVDALDFPFEIRSDEHREVEVLLSDHPTELTGLVRDSSGALSLNHTVVVFALDERFWTPRSRRIVAVRPDSNGGFRVSGLPPGEYLVAVADPDIYGQPSSSLLRGLREGFPSIVLHPGERRVLELFATH